MKVGSYRWLFWTHTVVGTVLLIPSLLGVAADWADAFELRNSAFADPNVLRPIITTFVDGFLVYILARCWFVLRSGDYSLLRGRFGVVSAALWFLSSGDAFLMLKSFWPKAEDWVGYDDDLGEQVNLAVPCAKAAVYGGVFFLLGICCLILRFASPPTDPSNSLET